MSLDSPKEKVVWHLKYSGLKHFFPKSKVSLIFLTFSRIQAFSLIYFSISNLAACFTTSIPFKDRMESGQYFTSSLHVMGKHFTVLFQQHRMNSILNQLDKKWKESSKNPDYHEILAKANRSIKIWTWMIFAAFNAVVPAMIFNCVVENIRLTREGIDGHRLPAYYWAPLQGNNFWIPAFIQVFSMHCTVISVASCMIFSKAVISHSKAQMEILQMKLESRGRNSSKESFREMYILHQDILSLVWEYNGFFALQLVFEMLLSSIQLAFRGSSFIQGVKEGNIILQYIVFLCLTLGAPYLICANGSVIETGNELIYRSAYQNEWYRENVATRKDLMIFTTMATKPLNLKYKTLLTLSMEQYTTLLQATYSFLAMILNFS